jgi:dTMP kinase
LPSYFSAEALEQVVFVVIDGLDASGKDTQAMRLRDFLESNGKTVFLRVHPSSDNLLGARARQFLLSKGKSAHFASALFYMFDVVRSILLYSWKKYDYVIFVRYLMGTAYLPSPLHRFAYVFFVSFVPTSDLMFFLDIKPEEAHSRIQQGRNRREMFENLKELERVRCKALSLALAGKWTIVDASRSAEEVEREIRRECLGS